MHHRRLIGKKPQSGRVQQNLTEAKDPSRSLCQVFTCVSLLVCVITQKILNHETLKRRMSPGPELTLLTFGADPDGGTDPGIFF